MEQQTKHTAGKRFGIKLSFKEETAYKFLRFAIRYGLSDTEIEKGKSDTYDVRTNPKSKQSAFELGAAWHSFMNEEKKLNAFLEWRYSEKSETLTSCNKVCL